MMLFPDKLETDDIVANSKNHYTTNCTSIKRNRIHGFGRECGTTYSNDRDRNEIKAKGSERGHRIEIIFMVLHGIKQTQKLNTEYTNISYTFYLYIIIGRML